MALYKVEICGVNTAKLPVLKSAETRMLLEKARQGEQYCQKSFVGHVSKMKFDWVVGEGEMVFQECRSVGDRSVDDSVAKMKDKLFSTLLSEASLLHSYTPERLPLIPPFPHSPV